MKDESLNGPKLVLALARMSPREGGDPIFVITVTPVKAGANQFNNAIPAFAGMT